MEDEEEGLCEEDRALQPFVPAIVTTCDATGAADFWANSIPVMQRERISNVEIRHFKVKFKEEFSVIKYFVFREMKAVSAAVYTIEKQIKKTKKKQVQKTKKIQ